MTVVLTSGRPLEGMTAYLAELGLTGQDDYVICCNGALVQQVAGSAHHPQPVADRQRRQRHRPPGLLSWG